MSTAPTLPPRDEWTVDDLAELPRDLNYELVNGMLIVPSPTAPHQDLMGDVWLALRHTCPTGLVAVMDLSLHIDRRNEPRPDVVVVSTDHLAKSPVPIADAVLAVEIISPDSTFRDMVEKAKLYAGAGIGRYWVLDPLGPEISLTEFVLEETPRRYAVGQHTTGLFSTETPWSVEIDLPALTKRRADLISKQVGTA